MIFFGRPTRKLYPPSLPPALSPWTSGCSGSSAGAGQIDWVKMYVLGRFFLGVEEVETSEKAAARTVEYDRVRVGVGH